MSWRPLPDRRAADPRPPRRVADSLPAVSRRIGGPEGAAMVEVHRHWADIAGPAVAAHSRPLRLSGGVLVVGVDDPAWATELTYLQDALRSRVEEAVGPGRVSAVKVVVRSRRPPVW